MAWWSHDNFKLVNITIPLDEMKTKRRNTERA